MLCRQYIEAVADFAEFFGFLQNFVGWQIERLSTSIQEAGPAFINAVSHLRSHHIKSMRARSLFSLDHSKQGAFYFLARNENRRELNFLAPVSLISCAPCLGAHRFSRGASITHGFASVPLTAQGGGGGDGDRSEDDDGLQPPLPAPATRQMSRGRRQA